MKKMTIFVVAAVCLVLCIFGMAMTRRDPAHCALCEAPESDVPCVLDLHSGEVAELRISTGELSDDPSTFTFSFMDVLGNTGYRDTGARMCKVTLPQDNLRMLPSCFCRDCREKLQSVRKDHYAVLDAANKDVYPLQGSSFIISWYSVTIAKEERGMCVTVQSIR